MSPTSASDWIRALFDSFDEERFPAPFSDPLRFPGYADRHSGAAHASGVEESVVVGVGQLGAYRVAAAVFEFGFLGGSMGVAAGERVARAFELAARERIPVVVVTSSGGARMEEGMAALAQMPRTVAASIEASRAGVPRLGVLAHPTTGGVYASFASLSDFIVAEAGATIGFAGPRVVKALTGESLPKRSHTAEAAYEAGLVDAVLPAAEIRRWLEALLEALRPPGPGPPGSAAPEPGHPPSPEPGHPDSPGAGHPDSPGAGHPDSPGAWDQYRLARHADRPAPRYYIDRLMPGWVELHGDRAGSDDPAVLVGTARYAESPLMVIALDRQQPSASGYRKARRGIEIAGRLGLPVVSFIDTPGADPRRDSEYSGLASEIARTFEAMLTVPSPVLCLVTGEGGSGGALALACGDRVGVQEHAVFSVIAPEGAAAILHRDPGRAAEVAESLKPTAGDLVDLGLADDLIGEPEGGAHQARESAAAQVGRWLQLALQDTQPDPAARAARYRVRE